MKEDQNEKQGLFTFLKRVQSGEYATIETSSLSYTRMKEETELTEEIFYYGIS